MDELWQRYRTFWTPVLIGLGVLLLGIIVVHIITDDPEDESKRLNSATKRLRNMQVPNPNMAKMLRDKVQTMRANITKWAARIDQTGTFGKSLEEKAAEQVLQAAVLRGTLTPDQIRDLRKRIETNPEDRDAKKMLAEQKINLAKRFGDDPIAGQRAQQRFTDALAAQKTLLTTGDPNVAFSRILGEAWSELRVRANRADMELPDTLGFGAVNSVTRATLASRVLNLALVARVVDICIHSGMRSIDQIRIESIVHPSRPNEFIVSWPVTFSFTGPFTAVQYLLEEVTDPSHPTPIVENSTITQPPSRAGGMSSGLARMEITLASTVVRPEADLGLEGTEEDR